MGNKRFEVHLVFDHDASSSRSRAGEVVTGRVLILVRPNGIGDDIGDGTDILLDAILRDGLSCMCVVLHGREISQIASGEAGAAGSSRGDRRAPPTGQSSRMLVRKVHRLANFGDPASLPPPSSDGTFEFPFRFRLPDDLPGSFLCAAHGCNFAEIRYFMSAYLLKPSELSEDEFSRSAPFAFPDASRMASATIKIRASPTPVPAPAMRNFEEPCVAEDETEVFPLKSRFCCLHWDLGEVSLGLRIRNKVVGAGRSLEVECYGENNSEATVSHLTVKLIETITWIIKPSTVEASNPTSIVTTTTATGVASATSRRGTSRSSSTSLGGRKKIKTVQNILSREKVSLDCSCALWRRAGLDQPLLPPDPERRTGEDGAGGGLLDERLLVTVYLDVPEHSVDTYKSELIEVRHSVTVTAHTRTPGLLLSATPEVSRSDVRIVRQEPDADNGSREIARCRRGRGPGRDGGGRRGGRRGLRLGRRGLADAPAYATAVVIPRDWNPAPADASIVGPDAIPEATAVPVADDAIDDIARDGHYRPRPAAPPGDPRDEGDDRLPVAVDDDRGGNDRLVPVPSAPMEEPNDDDAVPGTGAAERRASDLEALRSLVRDRPENLTAVLSDEDDDGWSGLVRDLSPTELRSVLLSSISVSAPSAPDAERIRLETARTLARSMGSGLTCRHVLACLYGCAQQDAEMRTIVLTTVAPMASDLDRYQSLIEQELRPDEIVRFHAALYGQSRGKDGRNR